MDPRRLLIVDDEKNIRLTLAQALEPLSPAVDTAADGEEALVKLAQGEVAAMLLDLKMPGMDGLEVLRRSRKIAPRLPVIIITAHGTIESAVDAMKLGAVDFIQKPFQAHEIRELVATVLRRKELTAAAPADYDTRIEIAKLRVNEGDFGEAIEHVREAIGTEPGRPEAFNLLGVLLEIEGDRDEARKSYRAALALDPAYRPARENLTRLTAWGKVPGAVVLGGRPDEPEPGGAKPAEPNAE
jgi:DNA-binding response OmpR family regulator